MAGGGFSVTKGARRATRIGGHLGAEEKSAANRKTRRKARAKIKHDGADLEILVTPLYTDWDVI